jgi:hypothetical protein
MFTLLLLASLVTVGNEGLKIHPSNITLTPSYKANLQQAPRGRKTFAEIQDDSEDTSLSPEVRAAVHPESAFKSDVSSF